MIQWGMEQILSPDNAMDLHLHTVVSDGYHTPPQMLEAAAAAGLKTVSLTDHDAVGAYRHWPGLLERAKALGLDLKVGIELDTQFLEQEVHLLGYDFHLDDPDLNEHLDKVQKQRRVRIGDQVRQVNRMVGRELIRHEELFPQGRDTLMKPHLIRPLLETGTVGEQYGEVQKWFGEHVHTSFEVDKLPMREAIAMIHRAGGKAVLAHPGFIKGLPEDRLAPFLGLVLDRLQAWGLDGVEVAYNYQDPRRAEREPDAEAQREARLVATIRRLCLERNLLMTRGSDAHRAEDIAPFATRGFQG